MKHPSTTAAPIAAEQSNADATPAAPPARRVAVESATEDGARWRQVIAMRHVSAHAIAQPARV
jgi:hypothetical protein